jgi:large subunit ribosomal protein L6
MVTGVSEGFEKKLEIQGVGFRAAMQGDELVLNLGKSHQDKFKNSAGVKYTVPDPNTIIVSGIDKQVVGQAAAVVRSMRPPEPYKGKGIRYFGERVVRKEGKTGSKK